MKVIIIDSSQRSRNAMISALESQGIAASLSAYATVGEVTPSPADMAILVNTQRADPKRLIDLLAQYGRKKGRSLAPISVGYGSPKKGFGEFDFICDTCHSRRKASKELVLLVNTGATNIL